MRISGALVAVPWWLVLVTVLQPGCRPAEVEVVRATDLGPLETTSAVRARDGGYSGTFQGHFVWLYGDTILAFEGEDGSAWRNNTASWTLDDDASDGITGFDEEVDELGAPREFLPRTAEEAAFNDAHSGDECEEPCGARYALWPGAMVEDAPRERALVFYFEIYGEPGDWNFWGVGHGLAVLEDLDAGPWRPEVRPDHEYPTLRWDADEPSFGGAALGHEGFLYAWGCDVPDLPGKPCKLGRVPWTDALQRDAWEYYAGGDRWSGDVDDARTVFEGNSQLSVHYSPYLDRFLAAYVEGVSDRVVLRTAPAPEGPWSAEVKAFDALPAAGDGWVYCGIGHPEHARDDGRYEYISYYRETGDWEGEVRLVELELEAR